jgi:hypothetical protein
MENSVFWGETADWLMSLGLPYISEFEAMLITAAACLVLLLILWLAFRRARLWYWKTDIQIDTLKCIDGRLQKVEDKLSQSAFGTEENTESDPPDKDGEVQPPEAAQVKSEAESRLLTAVGRSGRIYTEPELEIQIRE